VPDILNTIRVALGLLVGCDTTLLHVVALSLAVSLSASGVATVCGLPLGIAVAVFCFRGRHIMLILLANRAVGVAPGRRRPRPLSSAVALGAAWHSWDSVYTDRHGLAQFMLALLIVVALSVATWWASGGTTGMTCWSLARAASGPSLIFCRLAGWKP
jgi:ABC-type tungstate transport system substrate-binding protein